MNKIKKALYLHIPFCKSRCNYCDFYSNTNYKIEDDFVSALIAELSLFKGQNISTIYLGGGTPSSLKNQNIFKVLDYIFNNFNVDENAEITIETNPEDLTKNNILAFKNFGANRLSIGVQSLNSRVLKALSRNFDQKQFLKNLNYLTKTFNNFSFDIMLGLPYDTAKTFKETLNKLLEFEPPHISAYGLFLAEETLLYSLSKTNKIEIPNDDFQYDLYCILYDILSAKNYERYEISNFAKDNFYSRHNLAYWRHIDYIGIGPSAHSFYDNKRYENIKDIKEYIKVFKEQDYKNIYYSKIKKLIETLDKNDLLYEEIILLLRLKSGINIKEINKKYDIDFLKKYSKVLEKNKEYLDINKNIVKIKEDYVYTSNQIMSDF